MIKVRFGRQVRGGLFFLDSGAALQVGGQAQIEIGRGVRILRDFTGDFFGTVRIGSNVFFNRGCHIAALKEVVIGDGCLFGERVSIHDENHTFGPQVHGVALPDRPMRTASVRIGKNVWVGANATILSGVSVGDGAVIAAHAVVVSDVPPHTLVAGVPARVQRDWSLDLPRPSDRETTLDAHS